MVSQESLLAHLADRFVSQRENLATEALSYLLAHDSIADAFQRFLERNSPEIGTFSRFETQQAAETDSGIPDLVGITATGDAPLLVEAKFSAALTAHQPVTYVRRLEMLERPTLLLFLVPIRRAEPVWHQIVQRCVDVGIELTISDHARRVARWRNVTVALTSWSELLDELSKVLGPNEHQTELGELAQLRGLCEREDREAFRPLTDDELSGSVGQRMVELNTLLVEAVDVLTSEGRADVRNLRWSAGDGWFGKYFRLKGHQCLLHVNFQRWGRERSTPLWLRLWFSDTGPISALDSISHLGPSRLITTGGRTLLPLDLPTGVDRDAVLDRILTQLREVEILLPDATQSHSSETHTETDETT